MPAPVHALLVPWHGFGHIIPMVQLGQLLASSGCLITIVYSSHTHSRLLRAGFFESSHHRIRVEVISDGLCTDEMRQPSEEERKKSIEVMQNGVEELIESSLNRDSRVTHLISATFVPWTHAVAKKFGIPRVELWPSLATIYAIGVHVPLLATHGFIPCTGQRDETWITCIPGVPPMRASDYPPEFLSGTKILSLCADLFGHGKEAQVVLVNSIYELESSVFDALRADNIPVSAIGPLFLRCLNVPKASLYPEDETCLRWLDKQEASSVLYIAFGSNMLMSASDVQELALGLEASEHKFLWVIRPGSVLGEGSVSEPLLEELKQRTSHQGLMVSWVPQLAVLSHNSVGGFLSHCGWNSVMESIWAGVPLIAWPQRADQGVNKKMIVEDWKIGVEMEGGEVSRWKVEKAVREVMEGVCGKEARRKIWDLTELMKASLEGGGSSKQNMEAFMHELQQTT